MGFMLAPETAEASKMLRRKISFIVLVLACLVAGGCGAKGGGAGRGSGAGGGTPTGNPVFVSNSSGSVSTYLLDPSTGSLQTITGSPVSTGGTSPDSMAVDPTHAHLLVTNLAAGTTAVFSLNSSTGALQPVTGSPFQTTQSQVRIAVHPNGNFVYTLVNSPSEVIGYSYSSTSGALTALAGFPITLGFPGASGLVITSSGNFLFASNPAANTISSFSVDPSTGALALLGTATSVSGAQ